VISSFYSSLIITFKSDQRAMEIRNNSSISKIGINIINGRIVRVREKERKGRRSYSKEDEIVKQFAKLSGAMQPDLTSLLTVETRHKLIVG